MSEKLSLLTELNEQTGGTITLDDKAKCNILGVGRIGCDSSNSIDDVILVDVFKYNLLSISQLCDKGNQAVFDKKECEVKCIEIW